jgi:hypothetical protein
VRGGGVGGVADWNGEMTKSTANSKTTAKPRGKPWQKGQSGNPAGAPKRGESWAEIIKQYGDMTPVEVADRVNEVAKQLRKIGKGVTLKEAVVVRVYAALMFEPSASLLNSFMERAEGKVETPLKHSGEISLGWKEFASLDNDPDAETDN